MADATADEFSLQHEIFVLDAYLEKSLSAFQYRLITENLVDALLAALRMEPLGELQIYPAADLRAPGWSFLQPITTSHISGHYFQKPGRLPHIRFDAYSCKPVDWQHIIRVLNEHLCLDEWRATFISRSIEQTDSRTILDIQGRGTDVLLQTKLEAKDAAHIAEKVTQENLDAVLT